MARRAKAGSSGDSRLAGDYYCPGNPRHGALLFHPGWSKLYCPHSDHDGRPAHRERVAVAGSARWFSTTEALTSIPRDEEPEAA